MADADAEPERSHTRGVAHLLADLFEHSPSPGVVCGEHVGELGDVVASATLPRHVPQVGAVVNAQVVERRQVVLVDGVPETQLGGNTAVEVNEDVEAIGSLGRGGKAEELVRLDSSQEGFVGRSGCVMEFVDDHDVEMRRIDGMNAGCVEALDRGEDVLEAGWTIPTDPLLAECGVPEGMAERRSALMEDLLTVGNEEQPVPWKRHAQPAVIHRSHDRLARAGGGYK